MESTNQDTLLNQRSNTYQNTNYNNPKQRILTYDSDDDSDSEENRIKEEEEKARHESIFKNIIRQKNKLDFLKVQSLDAELERYMVEPKNKFPIELGLKVKNKLIPKKYVSSFGDALCHKVYGSKLIEDIVIKLEKVKLERIERDKIKIVLEDQKDKDDNFVGFLSEEDQQEKVMRKIQKIEDHIKLENKSKVEKNFEYQKISHDRQVNYKLTPIRVQENLCLTSAVAKLAGRSLPINYSDNCKNHFKSCKPHLHTINPIVSESNDEISENNKIGQKDFKLNFNKNASQPILTRSLKMKPKYSEKSQEQKMGLSNQISPRVLSESNLNTDLQKDYNFFLTENISQNNESVVQKPISGQNALLSRDEISSNNCSHSFIRGSVRNSFDDLSFKFNPNLPDHKIKTGRSNTKYNISSFQQKTDDHLPRVLSPNDFNSIKSRKTSKTFFNTSREINNSVSKIKNKNTQINSFLSSRNDLNQTNNANSIFINKNKTRSFDRTQKNKFFLDDDKTLREKLIQTYNDTQDHHDELVQKPTFTDFKNKTDFFVKMNEGKIEGCIEIAHEPHSCQKGLTKSEQYKQKCANPYENSRIFVLDLKKMRRNQFKSDFNKSKK